MLSIVPNKTIVAKKYAYVVGVDTHSKTHTFAIVSSIGEMIGGGKCRAIPKDFPYMLSAIKTQTGESTVLFAIEGTGNFGETLAQFLLRSNHDVCEAAPPRAKARSGIGKSDSIDAEMAARSVLHLPIYKLIQVRRGDERKILRIALSVRSNLSKQQKMDKQSLIALARSIDIGIDARQAFNLTAIREIAASHPRPSDAPHEAVARAATKQFATNILNYETSLTNNLSLLKKQVDLIAPDLLSIMGVGPVCAAQILCAYSHKGRIRSIAAFASLAGVAPLPASSGNTIHYRLNRNGDRTLNQALDIIVKNRMRIDQRTHEYMEKRIRTGKSKKDIARILKCYVARSIFKQLEHMNLGA